jgi:hypothetical protein
MGEPGAEQGDERLDPGDPDARLGEVEPGPRRPGGRAGSSPRAGSPGFVLAPDRIALAIRSERAMERPASVRGRPRDDTDSSFARVRDTIAMSLSVRPGPCRLSPPWTAFGQN